MIIRKMNPRVLSLALALLVASGLTVASRALALTEDEGALLSLANVVVTGQSGSNQAYASRMAISGTYALVNWTNGTNSAGVLLASKASGTWQTLKSGAGEPSATDLEGLGVDSTDAAFLVANLRPLPPTNGYSGAASGTSTHTIYTERCYNNGTFTNYQYSSGSNAVTFSTPSIQPLNPASAVTATSRFRAVRRQSH